jgi:hypothetical protein
MDDALLSEVLDGIECLNTWGCNLWFPDERSESGVVDLCDFIEYKFFSTEVNLGQHKYLDENGYFFPDGLYRGEEKEINLKEALKEAARKAGFELFAESRRKHTQQSTWKLEVRLACNRARECRSKKLDELQSNVVMSDGAVLLPGVADQKLRNKRGQKGTCPSRRKTTSKRSIEKENCCPFRIVVALHSTNSRWYVKFLDLRKDESIRNILPHTHLGHPQLMSDHLASSTKLLTEDDLESIKKYTELHFTSSQAALLLSKEDTNFLPRQLAWLSKKAIEPSTFLTSEASSAEKLLAYLDSQEDITWISLMDKRGTSSGMVVTTNKGRPKGSKNARNRSVEEVQDAALNKKFDGDAIRHQLKLSVDQSILLAVGWISDNERRLVSMFPEVLFMDVTSQTNNEKRGLFVVAGKDSCARGFTATRIFLPSEQKWVFSWIFGYALPFLFGHSVLKRNKIVITDGDSNMYESLNEHTCYGGLWHGTHHLLCQWHLLNVSWRRDVRPHIPAKEVNLKYVGKKGDAWNDPIGLFVIAYIFFLFS